jgi:2,5-furandicarboxylate decarboxylase 1
MPKSLGTYLADLERLLPGELVRIEREVDPAGYDCTAIVKHLAALKKFPAVLFERPRAFDGRPSDVRLLLSAESTQGKIQAALGVPFEMTRAEMGNECLRREASPIPITIVGPGQAPVKEAVRSGAAASLHELPLMRHHHLDSGPYLLMVTAMRHRASGAHTTSFHRMEVKGPRLASFALSPQPWELFQAYEDADEECPVATILGHHPAFNVGAVSRVGADSVGYERIGAYLQESLRVTPSETWGDRLLVPADAEVIVEGALLPHRRLSDGPFGEATGYTGPGLHQSALHYEVRAITHRRDAIAQSILTPEGEKPWLELAREAAYLQRAREVVPTVSAVCKAGRHAYFNVFVAMKKTSDGDPARVAAALLAFEQTKHVFVFDQDVDVFDPAAVLQALAWRVQPHAQVHVLPRKLKGSWLDPSVRALYSDDLTSGLIVDATRPLRPE